MSQTATQERRSALDEFAASISAGEVVPARLEPHTLAILSRSEIDAQVASAGTRPRDLARFRADVRAIALSSEEAAADCHYALPARKDDGEPIEGPGIRFAEIMVYGFGNCRVGARVIDEAMDHVTAQGIFSDLEKNTVTTQEIRRRITDRRGRRYSLDMINVTANAACAIARRNAILQGIPKPLWWDIYEAARRMAAGSEAELGLRRDKAIGAFRDLGVDEQRIFAMLGVDSADQIDLDRLARLRGIYTAVKEGSVSIKEVGAPAEKTQATNEKTSSALDDFAAGVKGDAAPAAEGAAEGFGSAAPQTAAAAEDPPHGGAGGSVSPPLAAADRTEAIDRLLALAADPDTTIEEKLETLDQLVPVYGDKYGQAFTETALPTIAKVIRGELKPAAAKKYLGSLR